jgi:hypothetical protein
MRFVSRHLDCYLTVEAAKIAELQIAEFTEEQSHAEDSYHRVMNGWLPVLLRETLLLGVLCDL